MSIPDWSPGHIVGRKYTVQQVLGRTPLTRTYAALTEPNKEVVLRVFGPEASDAVDALMLHIPDFATMPEPGILRVLEVGHDPASGTRFVVTERSRNPSLASLVELCPLALGEGLAFASKLARIIDTAHAKKVVHLGLGPTNVFVGPMPGGAVEVADFSLPDVGPMSFERARWQAPEVIAEHEPGDAADVFAVALLVFHALTGKSYWRAVDLDGLAVELSAPRPRASARARELGVTLPAELDTAFEAALAPDASKRPRRATEFAEALTGKPLPQLVSHAPPPPVPRARSVPPTEEDIPPPPEHLLREVAPILAPSTMVIGDAPPLKKPTSSSPSAEPAHAAPLPSPPSPPSSPPATPHADEPSVIVAQSEPRLVVTPAPLPALAPPALAYPPNPAPSFVPPPVVARPNARRSRAVTIALGAIAATCFLLGGIIFVVALRKKPTSASGAGAASASAASTTRAATVPSVAESAAPSASAVAAAPSPTVDAAVPNDLGASPTAPTLTLGPGESELDVVCDPDPCKLVMVDRKKMTSYPDPMILPPGKHGVGIDAEGYWGDWKLVTTNAGERTVVTFKLNKRPPNVPWPKPAWKK